MRLKTQITLLLLLLLTITSCSTKQNRIKLMYSDLQPSIDAYGDKALEIWADNEALAVSYFNDSIPNLISSSYISDYEFNLVNGSTLNTSSIQKPIYLQVGSRGCAPCIAEIPALNDIVENYSDDISFILLMEYDSKEALLNVQNEYHQDINLVYYSEKENENRKSTDPGVFSGFKHFVKALPTNYLVNKNRQIIKLTGGATIPRNYIDGDGREITITKEEAYQKNYTKLKQEIELLLGE